MTVVTHRAPGLRGPRGPRDALEGTSGPAQSREPKRGEHGWGAVDKGASASIPRVPHRVAGASSRRGNSFPQGGRFRKAELWCLL